MFQKLAVAAYKLGGWYTKWCVGKEHYKGQHKAQDQRWSAWTTEAVRLYWGKVKGLRILNIVYLDVDRLVVFKEIVYRPCQVAWTLFVSQGSTETSCKNGCSWYLQSMLFLLCHAPCQFGNIAVHKKEFSRLKACLPVINCVWTSTKVILKGPGIPIYKLCVNKESISKVPGRQCTCLHFINCV